MKFSIAVVQFNPTRNNVKKNIRKLQRLLSDVKADLVVLPELSNTGYLYANHEDLLPLAEPQDGSEPFLTALGEMAAQTWRHDC